MGSVSGLVVPKAVHLWLRNLRKNLGYLPDMGRTLSSYFIIKKIQIIDEHVCYLSPNLNSKSSYELFLLYIAYLTGGEMVSALSYGIQGQQFEPR